MDYGFNVQGKTQINEEDEQLQLEQETADPYANTDSNPYGAVDLE